MSWIDRAGLVDHHHVGRDRADVDAEVGGNAAVARRRRGTAPTRSRSSTTLSIESGVPSSGTRARPSCWRRRWISPKERLRGSSASSMAVPMAPHQAYSSGHDQLAPRPARTPRAAPPRRPRSATTAPMKRHRRLDRPALDDAALEVARHGVAQAAQDLRRRVALLLRVDHVATWRRPSSGRRCAPRDARRTTTLAHLLDRVAACAAPAGRGTTRCPAAHSPLRS